MDAPNVHDSRYLADAQRQARVLENRARRHRFTGWLPC